MGVWQLISNNVYGLPRHQPAETLVAMTVLRLRADLMSWYPAHECQLPPEDRCRLQDLQVSMLGTTASPLLKTKGAETKPLVWFVQDMFERFKGDIPEVALWIRAAKALKRILVVMKAEGRVLGTAQLQDPT